MPAARPSMSTPDTAEAPEQPATGRARKDLVVSRESNAAQPIDEAEATRLADAAVEQAGGARMIYRNPRQAFSFNAIKTFTIDNHEVEVRWGEISSPAIATVGGYVFEILDTGIELLIRPPKPRG
jgi:hypothetical protein